MSRIGRKPILMPDGVSVKITGNRLTASGSNGELSVEILPRLEVKQTGNQIVVAPSVQDPETQKSFGLMRTLIDNVVIGVSRGYQRQLEINGVGYRASVSGQTVNLALGFSHPVVFELPKGIEVTVVKNIITVKGADKQQVGQVAANLRALKKPEPYKGKGIKYVEEHIRRKAGKTAAKG